VLTRKAASYKKGDIVAYKVPRHEMGAGIIVIHRIVGGSARTGYVIRGDNNPFEDPWHPKAADMVGKAAVLVPRAGKILLLLHAPVPLASLAAGVAVAMVVVPGDQKTSGAETPAGVGDGPVVDDPERGRRHRQKRRARHPERSPQPEGAGHEPAEDAADGARREEQPVAGFGHVQVGGGEEHEDGHPRRRQEVGDTEHQGEGAQQAMLPEPTKSLRDLGAQTRVFLGLTVWGDIGAAHEDDKDHGDGERSRVEEERSGGDGREEHAPAGRTDEFLGADLDDEEATVRLFQLLSRHDRGHERDGGVVEEGLARPEDEGVDTAAADHSFR
jgi:hypothetical protein